MEDDTDIIGSIKPRMGRPPYEVTEEARALVKAWASVGTPQETIAAELGICVDTLAKYYRAELDTAAERGVARIASTLFSKALAGDVTSMIFYLKTRGRWSEKAPLGDEDNPLVVKTDAGEKTLDAVLELATQVARAKTPNT